jgi:SRSO17 transposase
MAARVRPQDVRSTHQSMHHLVSASDWSDEALLATVAGQARGVVLGDAAYGDDCALRDELSEQGLVYALGIRPLTTVWWGAHPPATSHPPAATGRPRVRVRRDAAHAPISVRALAQALPARAYRTITWRQGSAEKLSGRFARVRVVTAHDDRARHAEWLVIEWPRGDAEPLRYWLSTLPEATTFKALVGTLKGRWRIERDYLELKQELGLGHYEGRNWRGFHHHASLCIAAYGFLTLERLRGSKKNRARFKASAVPEGFRPRGAGADAAASPVLDRDPALSSRPRDRSTPVTMSLLRQGTLKHQTCLVTQ